MKDKELEERMNVFRDKSRDELALHLISLGIRAEMAERGRVEEKMRSGFWWLGSKSLGIIDVPDGPIRWINVVRLKGRDRSAPIYRVVFGIPDESIGPNTKALKLKAVRKKTFPVFGKVVDIRWEGKDLFLSLIHVLSEDKGVTNMAKELGNLSARTHPNEFQGWTLEVDRLIRPTKLHWEAIQRLASHILSSRLG